MNLHREIWGFYGGFYCIASGCSSCVLKWKVSNVSKLLVPISETYISGVHLYNNHQYSLFSWMWPVARWTSTIACQNVWRQIIPLTSQTNLNMRVHSSLSSIAVSHTHVCIMHECTKLATVHDLFQIYRHVGFRVYCRECVFFYCHVIVLCLTTSKIEIKEWRHVNLILLGDLNTRLRS